MENFKAKIKEAWERDPIQVIAVTALAVGAAAKLIDSLAKARNSRSWDRETRRRDRDLR